MLNTALIFASSQLIVFLSIPFLSRAYSIEEFGVYAQFLVFYALIGNLANLRLADSITKNSAKDAASLSMAALLITGIVVPISVSLVWLLEANMKEIHVLYLLICCVLFSISRVGYFSALRNEKFSVAASSLAVLNIFTVIMQLILAGYSDGLILGLVSALVLTMLVLVSKGCIEIVSCSMDDVLHVVDKNKTYVKFLSAYSLVGVIRGRIPYLLLGNSGGAAALLMFERIAAAPSTLLAATLRPVFFRKFDASLSSLETWNLLEGFLVLGILGVVPAMVAVQMYSVEVVSFILGNQWAIYESEFRMTVTAFLILSVINWLDRYFDIIKKQRTIFGLEILVLTVFFLAFATAGYYDLARPVFFSLVVSSVVYYLAFVGAIAVYLEIEKRYIFYNLSFLISLYVGYYILLSFLKRILDGTWPVMIYAISALVLFSLYFFKSKSGLWVRKYLFVS